MKIYVLGSNYFIKEMVECAEKLCALGYRGWIHPEYIEHVRGGKKQKINHFAKGEHAAIKRAHDYIRQHYNNILKSDAVLIVNLEKKGIKNYIGGNCLIEMGQAYVNNKKIFLLNDIPDNLSYTDEVEAMDPICLHGDLSTIQK